MPANLIAVSKQAINALVNDSKKSAEIIKLQYVSDSEPGISRLRKGRGFVYRFKNTLVKDRETLQRIKKLVIPPAWKNVWICRTAKGHIQTTGLDKKERKQYKYHELWTQLRNQTKFYRMLEFGKALPGLRKQLRKDISKKELTEEKVIATVILLMEKTYIRIGNSTYEKLYGSHGLTTLKDKHVKIKGQEMTFAFKGKKGIHHTISIRNKNLARIVKQCRDIPGKELFQYKDEKGEFKTIDSGRVNRYIKDITGSEFTAKDFRTWAGPLSAMRALAEIGFSNKKSELTKNIVKALDLVSEELGNTRTVCKKYYVHPRILEMYEDQSLKAFLERNVGATMKNYGLAPDERKLIRLLKAS